MSLSDEIAAEGFAKQLEKILREGIKKGNPEISKFLKEHVYPMYKAEVTEAFIRENREIKEHYR